MRASSPWPSVDRGSPHAIFPVSLAAALERALRGLRYETIQLVVHEAKVVRIERTERVRLTGTPEAETTTPGQPTPTTEVRRHDTPEG